MKRLLTCLCLVPALWLFGSHPGSAQARASFDYPTDRNFLVLSYLLTGTGGKGEAPLTEIYGDGTMIVSNMEEVIAVLGVSPIDVTDLVKLLVDAGVLETTTQRLRKRCLDSLKDRSRAIALGRGENPDRIVATGPLSAPMTTISIQLAQYRPAGSENVAYDIQQTVSVRGLNFWSREIPEMKEVSALKAVVDAIQGYKEVRHD